MSEIKRGFEPVWNRESKVLILGSFPSVKSRSSSFYYGNPQNRFWKVLCGYFGESVPYDNDGKRQFLYRRNIALWDVVAECEIVGSQDATIKNYTVADIPEVIEKSNISLIIVNGNKAYEIYSKHFSSIKTPCVKLPSTSPANTRFDKNLWYAALKAAFDEV